MRSLVAIVLTLLVPALAGPVAATEAPSAPRGAQTVTVNQRDNRFSPRTITIERGTTVKWVNRGENVHTTTSNTGLWDSGTMAPGDTFRRRFRRPGTFRYRCTIHLLMTATITVT
jgi:plastocyanin